MRILRWTMAALALATLGCAGVGGEDQPGPAPDGGGSKGPVDVPDRLAPFLPANQRPAEVGTQDGAAFVRYDGLTLLAIEAAWPSSLQIVSRTDAKLLAVYWDDPTRSFGLVEADKRGDGVALIEVPLVPDSGLPRNNCAEGKVSLQAPLSGDQKVRGCVRPGAPGRLVGKFEIGNDDVKVLEGEYDARGQRVGTWTLRDDGGRLVSTGEFVDDRPFGRWTFGDQDQEGPDGATDEARSYAFVDGQTTDAPLAWLPVGSADDHPYEGASLALLDADLAAGWVHAVATYRGSAAVGRAPATCPTPGGERRLLLHADRREPAGDFVVNGLAFDGEPCTTPEQAAAATQEADAAFAADAHPPDALPAQLLGPAQRLELKADAAVTVPLPFEGTPHTLSLRVHDDPVTLEDQLSQPDLLDGSWESDERSTVWRIAVGLDRDEIESLWIRWPTNCPDAVWLEGLVVQGRAVAPVYRTDACDHGSRWVVGRVLEVPPDEPPP
jgi:hypothetical protein